MAFKRLTAGFVVLVVAGAAGALLHSQAPGPEIPKGTNVLVGRVLETGTDRPVAGAVVALTGYADASGRPIEPACAGCPAGASAPRSVITTAAGDFFFRELPAGRYSIVANAFGYVSRSYPLKMIELNNSDHPTSVQLHVATLAAISGTVLDDHGEPLAGVPIVALRRLMWGGSLVLRSVSAGHAETDDRGIYRIAQLQPGSYVVGVLSATTTLPAAVAAQVDAEALDQRRGMSLDLLPAGISLKTGEGVRLGDAVLQRTGPMPPPPAANSKWLAYATTFVPGTAAPGEATVFTLGSGDQRAGVDLALRLWPAVRVSGVATGPNGPMKNLAVRLLPPGGVDAADMDPAGVATAITDATGAFTFPEVTPGSYALRATFVDGARPGTAGATDVSLWALQPLTVADSDIAGLAVTLRPGIRVSGRVEFKGATAPRLGDSQRGAVILRPVAAQSWRSLRGLVEPDGTFTTPGDPPGRYVLYTPAPGGWTWQTVSRDGKIVMDDVIELESQDLSGLVFTFSKETNSISGSVADATGAGDVEADVIVFPADSAFWREGIINSRRVRSMHVTSAGAFETADLAPGDYYIAAVGQAMADWDGDPRFLERIIPGATKITLGEGEKKTVPLKTFTPKDR